MTPQQGKNTGNTRTIISVIYTLQEGEVRVMGGGGTE